VVVRAGGLAHNPTIGHDPVMTVTDPMSRLRSMLRDIREDLVRIDVLLERYAAAGTAAPPELWTDVKDLVDAEVGGIDKRLARVAGLIEHHDDLANACSDAVTRIENLWTDVARAWKPATRPPQVATLRQDIDRCVLEIGYLTVPDRANRVLRSLRVGAAMNFHENSTVVRVHASLPGETSSCLDSGAHWGRTLTEDLVYRVPGALFIVRPQVAVDTQRDRR
jgi:hypothetical protein